MGPDPAMFRALIERCPMVTYVCDAENRLTYICPQIEAWTGLPARLWTEDPTLWHSMLHPDDRERVVPRTSATARSTSSTACGAATAPGSGSGSTR